MGAIAIGVLKIRRLITTRGGAREHSTSGAPRLFESLEGHKYMSLTTFRKSGEAVSTTVWFVLYDGRLYITTDPTSGKMKRIRNDSRVLLAPSTRMGRPLDESVEGFAHPLQPGTASEDATRAFNNKYRLLLTVLHLLVSREIGTLTLEIRPTEGK